jgi:hypothetical protein
MGTRRIELSIFRDQSMNHSDQMKRNKYILNKELAELLELSGAVSRKNI